MLRRTLLMVASLVLCFLHVNPCFAQLFGDIDALRAEGRTYVYERTDMSGVSYFHLESCNPKTCDGKSCYRKAEQYAADGIWHTVGEYDERERYNFSLTPADESLRKQGLSTPHNGFLPVFPGFWMERCHYCGVETVHFRIDNSPFVYELGAQHKKDCSGATNVRNVTIQSVVVLCSLLGLLIALWRERRFRRLWFVGAGLVTVSLCMGLVFHQ